MSLLSHGVTVVMCVTVVTYVIVAGDSSDVCDTWRDSSSMRDSCDMRDSIASSTLHTSLLSHMRDSSSTVVHVLSYVTVVPWTSVTVAYYDSSYVVTTATCVTVVTCVGLSKFRYAK